MEKVNFIFKMDRTILGILKIACLMGMSFKKGTIIWN